MYEVVIKWYGREEEGLVYDSEEEGLEIYNNYRENASTLGLDYLLYKINNEIVSEWHWDDEPDLPDDVDETNYNPYMGCDDYEVDMGFFEDF